MIPTRYSIVDGSLAAGDITLAEGSIMRGNSSGVAAAHSAKTSGQILVGDGTTVASVAVSGDISLTSTGVTAIGATKVLASMLGANLAKGFIPLDIGSARIIAADVLSATSEGSFPDTNTDPILQRINGATDKGWRLVWAATSVIEVDFPPFAYPPDLDDTAAVEAHLLISKDSNTDTTATLAVSYFEGIGDTNAGGNTAALNATALTEYTVSVTAGNVGAHPNFAKIGITPSAHGTDAIRLHAAWIEYTRKS